MTYNWQQPDWPHFRYDLSAMLDVLFAIAEKMGRTSGQLSSLSLPLQTEAVLNLMVEEAIKTSKIEGEHLHRPDVRSSIKNKLNVAAAQVPVHDQRAQGIAELMLDVRQTFAKPLTAAKLFAWHRMLLPATLNKKLTVGQWRTHDEPMQIISGYHGKLNVHYEAPPSSQVPQEMKKFIQWFNQTAPGKPQAITFAPVRSAIAHLYFESIHPFEDGNGRVGRAIAEKALSQGWGYPVILSLSHAIEAAKKAYYAALKSASQSNEITQWIQYFIQIILTAQTDAEAQINFTLMKAKFFDMHKDNLNERQEKVIKRMWQAGISGFTGGMSAKKYMVITGASKATATRDLQQLLLLKVIKQIGGGRNVHYELSMV
jgi:Fic family protein